MGRRNRAHRAVGEVVGAAATGNLVLRPTFALSSRRPDPDARNHFAQTRCSTGHIIHLPRPSVEDRWHMNGRDGTARKLRWPLLMGDAPGRAEPAGSL